MARPLRIQFPGAVYHLTSRGNARQPVFLHDHDRQVFCQLLAQVVSRYAWRCHAYCLMDNHYHLLIETLEPTLAIGMRQLNGRYTQHFNVRHHRVGHVFQGRYTAILVEKESYLLELCRYVVLNPVRARMVQRPEAWPWSSYQATAGHTVPPSWLTTEWLLAQLAESRVRAQQVYRKFIEAGMAAPSPWQGLRGQIYLGSEAFCQQVAVPVTGAEEVPRRQRQPVRPSLIELFKDASAAPAQQIQQAYQAGYRLREIAQHLGVHYTTISRWLRRAEMHDCKT